jgi:sulfatase maturation enzyme AslB (radical SAM superfamily)
LCEYCFQAENEMNQEEVRLEIAQDEIVEEVAHVA